jgi:hypothetical protein
MGRPQYMGTDSNGIISFNEVRFFTELPTTSYWTVLRKYTVTEESNSFLPLKFSLPPNSVLSTSQLMSTFPENTVFFSVFPFAVTCNKWSDTMRVLRPGLETFFFNFPLSLQDPVV